MTTPSPDKKPKTLLQSVGEHFAERKKRARERLKMYQRNEWNFAIVGLSPDTPNVSLEGLAVFRSVVEPPGEIELAGALEDRASFGAIGRYSQSILHELAVSQNFAGDDFQPVWNFAWWLISGVRIRTRAEFLVPAVANCSWSVIAAIDDNTCKSQLLEDVPQSRRLAEPVRLVEEDFRWAFRNAITLGDLLEVPRFRLAVEALTTHQHLLSPRMMVADIWAGIEALMCISTELRFRLALTTVSLLEPRGAMRYERYCRIKKLYDVRSQAVHGGELDDTALRLHVVESRELLSQLICHMIEARKVFSKEEIERNVLE
jgi:hypothetical protein